MMPRHTLGPCPASFGLCNGLTIHYLLTQSICITRPKVCVGSTKMCLGTTGHILDRAVWENKRPAIIFLLSAITSMCTYKLSLASLKSSHKKKICLNFCLIGGIWSHNFLFI
jgi:uncharacterized membrane protein YjjB (DUF3815 family)